MPDGMPSPRIAALLMANMAGAVTARAIMAVRTVMPAAVLGAIAVITRSPRITAAIAATPVRSMASTAGAVTARAIMAVRTVSPVAALDDTTGIAVSTRLLRTAAAIAATPVRSMASTAGAVTARAIMAVRTVMPVAVMDVTTDLAVITRSPRTMVAIMGITANTAGAVTDHVITAVRMVTPVAALVLIMVPDRLPCTAVPVTKDTAGAAPWRSTVARRCRIIPVTLGMKAPAPVAKVLVRSAPAAPSRVDPENRGCS